MENRLTAYPLRDQTDDDESLTREDIRDWIIVGISLLVLAAAFLYAMNRG